MKKCVVVAALLLNGCSQTAAFVGTTRTSVINLPNGEQGYTINCDGTSQGMEACASAAGKQCGVFGYTIIVALNSGINRSIIIQCGTVQRMQKQSNNKVDVLCGPFRTTDGAKDDVSLAECIADMEKIGYSRSALGR